MAMCPAANTMCFQDVRVTCVGDHVLPSLSVSVYIYGCVYSVLVKRFWLEGTPRDFFYYPEYGNQSNYDAAPKPFATLLALIFVFLRK